MQMHVTRLTEGQDLKQGITDFVQSLDVPSAVIVSVVGSVSPARIRMAGASPDRQDVRDFTGSYEIVSLVGTITPTGKCHLHISISDADGVVYGGHLKQGCLVHTTAEVAIASQDGLLFDRLTDPKTGFDELVTAQEESRKE